MSAPQDVGFFAVVVDDSGPIGKSAMLSGARRTESARNLGELLGDANVYDCEWASKEEAKRYTPLGLDVLLLKTPGTHEVPKVSLRHSKAKPSRSGMDLLAKGASKAAVARSFMDDPEDKLCGYLDANEKRRETARNRSSTGHGPRALDAVSVIKECRCCATKYTEATFAELPFAGVGAKEIREGNTVITEVYRNCGCGSTLMTSSTREAA